MKTTLIILAFLAFFGLFLWFFLWDIKRRMKYNDALAKYREVRILAGNDLLEHAKETGFTTENIEQEKILHAELMKMRR